MSGVDFSSRLLADAMQRGRGARVVFSDAEASSLPFADACFDRVVCFNVLGSSPDREHALGVIRELVRVARPGARVVVGSLPDERCRERCHEKKSRRHKGLDDTVWDPAAPVLHYRSDL